MYQIICISRNDDIFNVMDALTPHSGQTKCLGLQFMNLDPSMSSCSLNDCMIASHMSVSKSTYPISSFRNLLPVILIGLDVPSICTQALSILTNRL